MSLCVSEKCASAASLREEDWLSSPLALCLGQRLFSSVFPRFIFFHFSIYACNKFDFSPQVLVVSTQSCDISVELHAVHCITAVPAVSLHSHLCIAGHAVIWWSVQL